MRLTGQAGSRCQEGRGCGVPGGGELPGAAGRHRTPSLPLSLAHRLLPFVAASFCRRAAPPRARPTACPRGAEGSGGGRSEEEAAHPPPHAAASSRRQPGHLHGRAWGELRLPTLPGLSRRAARRSPQLDCSPSWGCCWAQVPGRAGGRSACGWGLARTVAPARQGGSGVRECLTLPGGRGRCGAASGVRLGAPSPLRGQRPGRGGSLRPVGLITALAVMRAKPGCAEDTGGSAVSFSFR